MTIPNSTINIIADPENLRNTGTLFNESNQRVARDYQSMVHQNDNFKGLTEGDVLRSFSEMDDYLRDKMSLLGAILEGMHENTQQYTAGMEHINMKAEISAFPGGII